MIKSIEGLNEAALEWRRCSPSPGYLALSELTKLPKYFGWVDCKPGDFRMFLGGHDDGVALKYFYNRVYERVTSEFWSKFARVAELVLDVGAHTGSYSLMAGAANPSARIVAVEPYLLNYSRLCLNVAANQFERIKSRNIAASSESGILDFSIDTDATFHTSGGRLGSGGRSVFKVPVARLDDVLDPGSRKRLSLLKIDVEGAEAKVLKGLEVSLRKAKPPIFFECINQRGSDEVEVFLKNFGYEFYGINDESGEVWREHVLEVRRNELGKTEMATINRIAVQPGSIQHQTLLETMQ